MKRTFFLFVLMLYGITVSSQSQVVLTFHAKDSLTQSPLTLNSLYVNNLTEDCDTLLLDPITILTLFAEGTVGVGDQSAFSSSSFILLQNMPNPFTGETKVMIFLNEDGPLKLVLSDNLGKKLAECQGQFCKGWNMFILSANKPQQLLLSVSNKYASKSIRMINAGNNNHCNEIASAGQSWTKVSGLKSTQSNPGFIFYFGDQLSFTAHVNGYQDNILFDNPVSNETYMFSMIPTETLPIVTTDSITNITQTTATANGNVISDGGNPVTARGTCWSTSENPTLDDTHTIDGSGTGTFISNIAGLSPDSTYHARAYATNSQGTAYGADLIFTAQNLFTCGTSQVNYGGQDYNTIQIGSQCWLKENLNIGSMINLPTAQTNNSTIEKYCYDNNESNCNIYGGLYQWDEAMQYITAEGAQGICPDGWHIPTLAEGMNLVSFLGGLSVAGGPMKEVGTDHWDPPNTGATNSSGFTALGGGNVFNGLEFREIHQNFIMFTSTQYSSVSAEEYSIWYNYVNVYQAHVYKTRGLAIRCLKNE
ncbi:MAG: hypothetical protein HXX13_02040 [Bacteroidetes bacterium]|nr:hypothetical protein [Bacteroidota bacterium]